MNVNSDNRRDKDFYSLMITWMLIRRGILASPLRK